MTKDKIYEALQHFQRARAEADEGIAILCDLLAELDASDTYATSRRERFRVLAGRAEPKEKPDLSAGGELSDQGIIQFTDEEMKKMPEFIQKAIFINRKKCYLRTRECGQSYTYEIRFRRDGYNVSACGKTIKQAKERFIKKMAHAVPDPRRQRDIPSTFSAFAIFFFENFRKERVTETTYKGDLMRLKNYLQPHFGEKMLSRITPYDCKILIDGVIAKGRGKTAEELYCLLSVIFKGAYAHGLIDRNPLELVPRTKHERESGTALSREEERTLLSALEGTIYRTAVALSLYCGLRPNELRSAKLCGDFIVAVNSKRKTRKTEYKRIPISSKLRDVLPADGAFYIAE